MHRPQYLTDAEGNRTALVLDLAIYQEMLEAWEEADATRAYNRGKTLLADHELVPLDQARADLEALWARDQSDHQD